MCYLDVIASPEFDLVNSFILLLTAAVVIFLISSTILLIVAFLRLFRERRKNSEPEATNQDDPQI